ncbi:low affinity iron permease family protein [Pseudochryseolinea flava]|uniref:Low affinity iron permease family protein n=1 Tax=Pseudochryseolinea flava TaxID=2059302 RepID=A0A364Y4A8_9BACT|nr:low affinity iron permease family protein [Pseudochryseolinea flava]RAW01762.1 low affinity iron permease family protein [Pseudochryseolinea flava]
MNKTNDNKRKRRSKQGLSFYFDRFSSTATKVTGSSSAFIIAFAVIIVWAITGPLFNYSDTWQLVINTSTTIVTFLMVFIIQQSQNKDTMALQLKLNELIAATKGASNRLIDIEDLTEEELRVIKKFYVKLAALSQHEANLLVTHSIDEANDNHRSKITAKKKDKKK